MCLVVHLHEYGSLPWEQTVEMYIAMRRLGKPAWMLQYNVEGHGLIKKKNKIDFTIRGTQFFDHYLKGGGCTCLDDSGVSARLKGVETGLELDTKSKKT